MKVLYLPVFPGTDSSVLGTSTDALTAHPLPHLCHLQASSDPGLQLLAQEQLRAAGNRELLVPGSSVSNLLMRLSPE